MKILVQKADLVKPRTDHGILFIDESDNLLKLKTLDALIVFNPNSNPGTEPSPEEPSDSDKTTYIVSGAGTTWLNGEYTDTGVTYSGEPVYTFETTNANSDNTVAIIFYYDYEGRWILFDAPDYLSNTEEVIDYVNKNKSLYDLADMAGYMYYFSTNGIDGLWSKSYSGTDNAPTVTL